MQNDHASRFVGGLALVTGLRGLIAATVVGLVLCAGAFSEAAGQTINPAFAGIYTFVDLGSVPGVPASLGGVAFLANDPDTLLIGGRANEPGGAIFSIKVVRGAGAHITGFSGTASELSDAAFIDGGLAYGPADVLFYTRFPSNDIGEIKNGSSTTTKVVDLDPLGIGSSVGSLNFVPAGFPGAGQLKVVSYNSNGWYSVTFAADASGTFDLTAANLETTLPNVGPEGFIYVPTGSPLFTSATILVSEYDQGSIGAYTVDANGDPIVASRTLFMTDLGGAEGAVTDPRTGDFIFSTFGGSDRVIAVRGFAAPGIVPRPAPTLSSLMLGVVAGALVLAGMLVLARKRWSYY